MFVVFALSGRCVACRSVGVCDLRRTVRCFAHRSVGESVRLFCELFHSEEHDFEVIAFGECCQPWVIGWCVPCVQQL